VRSLSSLWAWVPDGQSDKSAGFEMTNPQPPDAYKARSSRTKAWLRDNIELRRARSGTRMLLTMSYWGINSLKGSLSFFPRSRDAHAFKQRERNRSGAFALAYITRKSRSNERCLITKFKIDPPFLDKRRPMRSSSAWDDFWITTLNLLGGQSLDKASVEPYFSTVAMGLDQEILRGRSISVPAASVEAWSWRWPGPYCSNAPLSDEKGS
jgi:hypothetical protein